MISFDISMKQMTLNSWSTILNFARDNFYKLTVDELQILAIISEQYRNYFNQPRKRFDKISKKEVFMPSLNINKEDVHPNIHKMLELKQSEPE